MSDYLAVRGGKFALETRESQIIRQISKGAIKYYRITLDENDVPSLSSEVVLSPSRVESVEKDISTLRDSAGDIGDFEV